MLSAGMKFNRASERGMRAQKQGVSMQSEGAQQPGRLLACNAAQGDFFP